MKLSDIATLNIKGYDYRCIISQISKSEAINLMENIDLTEKSRTLSNIKIYLRLKIIKTILTFKSNINV